MSFQTSLSPDSMSAHILKVISHTDLLYSRPLLLLLTDPVKTLIIQFVRRIS